MTAVRPAALASGPTTAESRATSTTPIVGRALRSAGRFLSPAVRASLEGRFGHDFGDVRVHADAAAAESAAVLGARAYTVGRDVVFGAGLYAPATARGRALLAHELTHVVQQSRGTGSVGGDEGAEAEADRNARAVTAGRACSVGIGVRPGRLQPQLFRPPEVDEGAQEIASILRAADRARKAPDDRTRMLINGSAMVYRLIHVYLPDRADRVSGVSYDPTVRGVRVDEEKGGISIAVGKEFVLGTTRRTLSERAAALRSAILSRVPRGEQDSLAVEGMKQAFCPTRQTGFEHCGHIIRTAKGGLRMTGPQTSKQDNLCHARDSIAQDETRVAYYHSHPEGQGYDFSAVGHGVSIGDTDRADQLGIDYYLIDGRGDMKRYSPATEIGGRGRKRSLGRALPGCGEKREPNS
jgi:hypothetical protein